MQQPTCAFNQGCNKNSILAHLKWEYRDLCSTLCSTGILASLYDSRGRASIGPAGDKRMQSTHVYQSKAQRN
eukprot:2757284-Amphidinium_carterae.2